MASKMLIALYASFVIASPTVPIQSLECDLIDPVLSAYPLSIETSVCSSFLHISTATTYVASSKKRGTMTDEQEDL